jgi:hypothetical protein
MAKAKKQSEEVIEVMAEEIEVPVSVKLQESINQEVKRFDPYEARMNEIRDKYSVLKIKGIDDKEGIEENRLAVADLRGIRVNTEKERKIIKAPFLKAASDIETRAQWIISGIAKIEEPLKIQRKEIQEEIDRIDREEREKILERNKVRTAQLSAMGAQFNGVDYVLDDVSYSLDTISGTDSEIYETKILPRYREVFEKNELVRLKMEHDKKIEDDRIAKEKKDLEDQQTELRKQQQDLKNAQDRLDKEKKDKEISEEKKRNDEIATRAKVRGKLLDSLGMVFNFVDQAFQAGAKRVSIDRQVLVDLDDTDWNLFIETQKPLIAKAKEDLQKDLDDAEKRRSDEATKRALESQIEKDRLDEIKRQEEIEEGKESIKYAETVRYLKGTPIYQFRSGRYIRKMSVIKDFLADLK